MPISGEIDLCNLRIEERTNAFDYVKADVSDALLAQPCHDEASLQRSRQAAEFFDRQTLIFCVGTFGHAVDPSFFFRCNRCRAQDARADFSTERFFQIGNDTAAKPVTQRSEIFIRSIFAKFQAMLSHVPVNFVPPNSEERPDNGKIDIFDSAHGNFAHRGETGETRPAKKVD